MKKKYLVNIILLTIMVFSIIVSIVFITWNKPHRNIMDTTAVKINAVDLYSALSHDSTKIKSDLLKNVVAVTGVIKQVQKNQEGAQVVLLQTNVPDASVNCTMEKNSKKIKVGDTINLKGICIGYIGMDEEIGLPGDVFLTRCYITF